MQATVHWVYIVSWLFNGPLCVCLSTAVMAQLTYTSNLRAFISGVDKARTEQADSRAFKGILGPFPGVSSMLWGMCHR